MHRSRQGGRIVKRVRRGRVRTLLFALCALGLSATVAAGAASGTTVIRSLRITEITQGGLGAFSFIVDPNGGDPTLVRAKTTHTGVPAQAGPEENLALLVTATYTITELLPGKSSGE